MALTSQYTDTTEPVADTDAEAATNQHLYGVISGCAVTFDASDLTYDVAAGTILHNGSVVAVSAQANAGTLSADGSNPRWATIYLDSSGVEGLVSGTAAADPSKPETGDNVAIAMVLIAAGATIASSQTTFDKRVMTHSPTQFKYKTDAQNFTTTTFADVTATSGNLAFTAAASISYWAEWELGLTATGTAGSGGLKLQLTGPASPTAVQIHVEVPYHALTDASTNSTPLTLSSASGAAITSFSSNIVNLNAHNPGTAVGIGLGIVRVRAVIVNGTTAGAVTLQAAQATAAGTTTITTGRMIVRPIVAAV